MSEGTKMVAVFITGSCGEIPLRCELEIEAGVEISSEKHLMIVWAMDGRCFNTLGPISFEKRLLAPTGPTFFPHV